MTLYICITCIAFLLLLVLYLFYKLYNFSLIILNVESAIERCLDILNERYKRMNDIVQKPIFFDSVEIRQVIAEIKASREAVLLIADELTTESGLKSEIEEEDVKDAEENF